LIKDLQRPKVLIYLGDPEFGKTWDAHYHRHVEKHLRTKGLTNSDARRAARAAIEQMRKFGSHRLPD
jgi:hypothetical protein